MLRDVLERSDPGFLQVREGGLRSRDRDRWVGIADALGSCNGKWFPLMLDLLAAEPEALCGLIAACRLEFRQTSANPERSIALALRKAPELEKRLGPLETHADPGARRMAAEARRILT